MEPSHPDGPKPEDQRRQCWGAICLMIIFTNLGWSAAASWRGPAAAHWGAVCGLAVGIAISALFGLAGPRRLAKLSPRWAVLYLAELGAALLVLGSVGLGWMLGGARGWCTGLIVGAVLLATSLVLYLAFHQQCEDVVLARRQPPG